MALDPIGKWFEYRTNISILWYGLGLAAVIEAITCVFRFGLGMQSTRDTAWLAALTFGYRIHHGYIGLVLLVLTVLPPLGGVLRKMLLLIGIALLISDFVHHFLVLWPATGSPQFDIRYPGH